jgi:hypothetical protein
LNEPVRSSSTKSTELVDEDTGAGSTVLLDDSDEQDEDDDVYATPIATPPPEAIIDPNVENNETTPTKPPDLNFYSNFTLKLNELQVVNGNLQTDNLQFYLNKGHSSYHLLEKFDINIQIGLSKLMSSRFRRSLESKYDMMSEEMKAKTDATPPIKIDINVNLLKLNIDDVKIINMYRTWSNFQRFLDAASARGVKKPLPSDGNNKPRFDVFNTSSMATGEAVGGKKTPLITYCAIDVKLNEVDITMSLSRDGSQHVHEDMNDFYALDVEDTDREVVDEHEDVLIQQDYEQRSGGQLHSPIKLVFADISYYNSFTILFQDPF